LLAIAFDYGTGRIFVVMLIALSVRIHKHLLLKALLGYHKKNYFGGDF